MKRQRCMAQSNKINFNGRLQCQNRFVSPKKDEADANGIVCTTGYCKRIFISLWMCRDGTCDWHRYHTNRLLFHFISNNYSFCCYCCIRVLNAPMPMSVSISPQVYNKRTNNSSLIAAAYFVIPSLSHSLSFSSIAHRVLFAWPIQFDHQRRRSGCHRWHNKMTFHSYIALLCVFKNLYNGNCNREIQVHATTITTTTSESEREREWFNSIMNRKKKSIEMWNGNACRWLTNCTRHQFVIYHKRSVSLIIRICMHVSILRFAWPNKGMKKRKKKRQIEWRKVWILQFNFLFLRSNLFVSAMSFNHSLFDEVAMTTATTTTTTAKSNYNLLNKDIEMRRLRECTWNILGRPSVMRSIRVDLRTHTSTQLLELLRRRERGRRKMCT